MNADLTPQALMLSEAFEEIQDAVYVKDLEGHYLMANAAALAIAGVERSALDEGLSDRDLFPDGWESIRETDHQTIESGVSVTVEEPLDIRGEMRVFLATKAPLRDSAGHTIGLIGIATDITDRKSSETALKRREAMLAEAQDIAHVGSWDWNFVTDQAIWSDELYKIFGVEPEDWSPHFESVFDVIHPDDSERIAKKVEASTKSGVGFESHLRIIRPDGDVRTVHARARVVRDLDGTPIRMLGAALDVTDRRKAAAERATGAAQLELAERLTATGSFDLEPQTGEMTWSDGLRELLGTDPEAAAGPTGLDHFLSRVHPHDRADRERAIQLVQSLGGTDKGRFRIVRGDGEVRWLEAVTRFLGAPGDPGGRVVSVCRDVTDRRADERAIRDELARSRELHDRLTALPNRRLAFELLDHAFELARGRGDDLAVLWIDIDGFDEVNERLGHSVGDELLVAIAERLRRVSRWNEAVARMGGDELLVICEPGDAKLDVAEAAERFRAAFAEPFRSASGEAGVSVSIGVAAIGGRELKRARQLVSEADDAMYEAKRSRR